MVLIILTMLTPIYVFFIHRLSIFNFSFLTIIDNAETKLTNSEFTYYRLLEYIRENIPKDDLFLVFRQNNFAYYLDRKLIRHLDPRLIPFYKIKDKQQAYNFLVSLGIKYIITVPYSLPTYYNSQISSIVSDPSLSELLYETANGYRLYKIYPPKNKVTVTTIKTPSLNEFHIRSCFSVWGPFSICSYKKPGITTVGNTTFLEMTNYSRFDKKYLFFSGTPITVKPRKTLYSSMLDSDTVYHLKAIVKGKGLVRVLLYQYTLLESKKKILTKVLWEGVLENPEHFKIIESQFMTAPFINSYRIVVELSGRGFLLFKAFSLEKVERKNKNEFILIKGDPLKNGYPILHSIRPKIISKANSGEIYIQQKDRFPVWLITKPIQVADIVKKCNLDIKRISANLSLPIQISGYLQGKGIIDLLILWEDNKNDYYLEKLYSYFPQQKYRKITEIFYVPKEIHIPYMKNNFIFNCITPNKIRFAIKLYQPSLLMKIKKVSPLSELYIKDFTYECLQANIE